MAQSNTTEKLTSVATILQDLENKYKCSFSYLDKDVTSININLISQFDDLDDAISFIAKNTPLEFTKLYENNFAISLSTEMVEICGKILTYSSETPIADAHITLSDANVYSDNSGNFSIPITSWNDILAINALGFQKKEIAVKDFFNLPCRTIFLTDKIELLKPVVINNFIIKGINKNYDNSITVNYSDFAIVPGQIEPDLLQTLQAIPGVISVNEKISDLNIRGGTQDQNLILWDGIKMYQTSHFFGLISAFNPYLTKNVTLYKNGSDAFYGDGVSSVIAMQTENTKQDSTLVSFGLNLLSLDGYIDTAINNASSLQVTARKSVSEILETPTYKSYFKKSFQDSEILNSNNSLSNTDEKLNFYDTSLRYIYEISDTDVLKINFLTIRNNLTFNENAVTDTIEENRESNLKQQSLSGGIFYGKRWKDYISSSVQVYGSNYVLESTNADIANDQRLFQQNEVLETGIRIDFQSQLDHRFKLSYGYQFNETGISHLRDLNNPTFRDFSKEVVRSNSIYSTLVFKSKDENTFITTGLRINKHNKFKSYYIEPRFNLNQNIVPDLSFQITGEAKSQVTSQLIDFQNDFLGVENRKWVLANEENVPILTSNQIATGLSYTPKSWLINAEIFYKKIDGILTKGQGFQNQFQNIEDQGAYTVKGIELLVNKRLRHLNVWFSYAYNQNNYQFENLIPSTFPNNLDVTHTATIALSYFYRKIKYSAGINWNSGRPTTTIDPLNPLSENSSINYNTPNGENLADYLRLDASVLYHFKLTKKIKAIAGFSIWNMTDNINSINSYYTLQNKNNSSQLKEINESGLRFTTNALFRINL